MHKILIQDSIKIAELAMSKTIEIGHQTNFWLLISIAEFGIIVFLILKKQLKSIESVKQRLKKESLQEPIDFSNIINSSFNSIQLYNELKVKCHPDRFPTDKEKNVIAEEIFQEISKNRNNIKRLVELKEEAIQKLNINF